MKTLLILVTVLAATASATRHQWGRWNHDTEEVNSLEDKSETDDDVCPYDDSDMDDDDIDSDYVVYLPDFSDTYGDVCLPPGSNGEADACLQTESYMEYVEYRPVLTGAKGEWGYGKRNGPHTWHKRYPLCGGPNQSPVALQTFKAIGDPSFEPFQFTNYNKLPCAMNIKNMGYTVRVRPSGLQATVSGGKLPGTYVFDEFHFHWGAVNSRGSEHTIDGHRYAGELHLLHSSVNHSNTITATQNQDGVAVLSVMLSLSAHNNPALKPIISCLASIPHPKNETRLPAFAIRDLLPRNTGHFFRYDGSFTTPPCTVGVIWTVFKEPIPISSYQLNVLRKLGGPDGPIQDNFRCPQPLNGRPVFLAQLY